MSEQHYKITANGKTAEVELIEPIGDWWGVSAREFALKIKDIKKDGITSCNVYINTVGGDCFVASEMVNIINRAFGHYTATGGALVASAGTYIACNAKTFKMAKNGLFMIHKPSLFVDGNDDEIKNSLELLKRITADYFDLYFGKTNKTKEFEAAWNSGRDLWLNAQETVEWGFADGVINKTATANAKFTAQVPYEVMQKINNNYNTNSTMDLKQKLVSKLGLTSISADASDDVVVEAIVFENQALKKQIEKNKEKEKSAIKAIIDKAIEQNKINAKQRETYEKIGENSGVEALNEVLADVTASVAIKDIIASKTSTDLDEIKTFTELQAKGEVFMSKFKAEKPEEYQKLFDAEFKKIKC